MGIRILFAVHDLFRLKCVSLSTSHSLKCRNEEIYEDSHEGSQKDTGCYFRIVKQASRNSKEETEPEILQFALNEKDYGESNSCLRSDR